MSELSRTLIEYWLYCQEFFLRIFIQVIKELIDGGAGITTTSTYITKNLLNKTEIPPLIDLFIFKIVNYMYRPCFLSNTTIAFLENVGWTLKLGFCNKMMFLDEENHYLFLSNLHENKTVSVIVFCNTASILSKSKRNMFKVRFVLFYMCYYPVRLNFQCALLFIVISVFKYRGLYSQGNCISIFVN